MKSFFDDDKPYFKEETLKKKLCEIKKQSLEIFDSHRKMGSKEFSKRYRKKLEEDIEKSDNDYKSLNESKKNTFLRKVKQLAVGAAVGGAAVGGAAGVVVATAGTAAVAAAVCGVTAAAVTIKVKTNF